MLVLCRLFFLDITLFCFFLFFGQSFFGFGGCAAGIIFLVLLLLLLDICSDVFWQSGVCFDTTGSSCLASQKLKQYLNFDLESQVLRRPAFLFFFSSVCTHSPGLQPRRSAPPPRDYSNLPSLVVKQQLVRGISEFFFLKQRMELAALTQRIQH